MNYLSRLGRAGANRLRSTMYLGGEKLKIEKLPQPLAAVSDDRPPPIAWDERTRFAVSGKEACSLTLRLHLAQFCVMLMSTVDDGASQMKGFEQSKRSIEAQAESWRYEGSPGSPGSQRPGFKGVSLATTGGWLPLSVREAGMA